ncbi:MAG: hypothetical protein ACR2HD_08165 [Solirubrobacteraceae bacterium]
MASRSECYYTFLDTPMVDAIEANPAATRARAAMPPPIRRTYPLDKAVKATVAGIDRRASRIIFPGSYGWGCYCGVSLGRAPMGRP